MWGMGLTTSEEILNPDQSTSFLQNWNLAGLCRMLLLPSVVRYSVVTRSNLL